MNYQENDVNSPQNGSANGVTNITNIIYNFNLTPSQ